MILNSPTLYTCISLYLIQKQKCDFFSRLYMAFEKHLRTYWKEQEKIIKLIMMVLPSASTVSGLIPTVSLQVPLPNQCSRAVLTRFALKTLQTLPGGVFSEVARSKH